MKTLLFFLALLPFWAGAQRPLAAKQVGGAPGLGYSLKSNVAGRGVWLPDAPALRPDWEQTDTGAADYIKNKPTEYLVYTVGEQEINGDKIFNSVLYSAMGLQVKRNGEVLGGIGTESIGAYYGTTIELKPASSSNDFTTLYAYPNTAPRSIMFPDGSGIVPLTVNGHGPDLQGNITLPTGSSQVNSDWNATSGVAQILNKPDLTTFVKTTGDQTIDGLKTFSSPVYSNGGFQLLDGSTVIGGFGVTNNGIGNGSSLQLKPPTSNYFTYLTPYTNTTARTLYLPNADGIMPVSVNGQTADANGNITISTGSQVNSDWNATSGTAQILNKPTIASGTYTPTVYGGDASATAYPCHFMRIGNEVSVDGTMTVSASGAGVGVNVTISLPTSTGNFNGFTQLSGTCVTLDGTTSISGKIAPNLGGQNAALFYYAGSSTLTTLTFHLQYTIQ